MTALALAAVRSARWQTSITLTADSLFAVVLTSQGLQRWLDNGTTTTKTKDEVKGGLLLDVVVREGATILELLSGEDQTLLVRGDTLLVLNLALNIVDGIRGLNLKGNGLTRECLDENLHLIPTVRDCLEVDSLGANN